MSIRTAIHGAAGRMGQRLVALASNDTELQVVAALESPDHPQTGKDAGLVAGVDPLGVAISAQLPDEVEVVIDFSVPDAAVAMTAICADQRIALVLATTGMDDRQQQLIHNAAGEIPIVWAPTMSLAVNLTMRLAEVAAQVLRDHSSGVDVEIIERHHRFKQDAPSGTALRFGTLISDIMGQTKHQHGREGLVGQRPADEIGYHALRVGDNPGEHTIVFGLLGETVELKVSSTNRDAYALGALTAAKFVTKQSPGLYDMYDVMQLGV